MIQTLHRTYRRLRYTDYDAVWDESLHRARLAAHALRYGSRPLAPVKEPAEEPAAPELTTAGKWKLAAAVGFLLGAALL